MSCGVGRCWGGLEKEEERSSLTVLTPAPLLQGSARRRVSIAVIPKQLLVRTCLVGTARSCVPRLGATSHPH